jgi:Flp pilus assembly protein TadD
VLPIILLLCVLAAAAGVVAYSWFRPKPVDMAAAMVANTRGVGRMERFEYAEAEQEFAEAVRLAPDWLPARINLGMAQFNQHTDAAAKARGETTLRDVLTKDADNKHAHYCLGIIAGDRGRTAEAHEHFAAVNKLDPDDPHTWLRLGLTHPSGVRSAEAQNCFEQALKRNPYLNAARYNLAQCLRPTDPARADKLDEEFKALKEATWEAESGIRYGEMGKYADVIGRDPSAAKPAVGPLPIFADAGAKVTLAPGARWATAADLDPLRKAARERFGGTIVVCDFNRDGRPDVFLASAVVENGKVRDLLLRNEGNGVFTDVTTAVGLAEPRASLGAAAGDYDNDGFPDLVVTCADGVRLFRNKGDGTFADVTAAAGLDKLTGVYLGCGWVDVDQDSDLDLILCRYADTAAAAGNFAPDGVKPGGAVELWENVGEAPPARPGGPRVALTTKFRSDNRLSQPVPAGSPVAFVASDLDGDRDIDLLVLLERQAPFVVENDRLMRFRGVGPLATPANPPPRWNGGLVLDANRDERSDLFLVSADGPPVFLLSKSGRDFAPGSTNSPRLKHAVAADIDMDGWADVVGLGIDGKPVLLHNLGDGRLEHKPDAFGDVPASAIAVACAHLGGDGPDLLLWTEAGLHLRRNSGNGNKAVQVEPTGRRDRSSDQRTNADGIGCWIVAQTGSHWTGAERTTTAAGLGQSLLPTALGLGKRDQADIIRVRWPDGVIQAEMNAAGQVRVVETNRKGTSCPVLLVWDGEKFVFVTDFLGAGALGELGPDGSVRPPRPEESVKIEPGRLVPKDGQFLLKIAEPMDEVLYLDRLQLVAIDHPADVSVYPDERFVASGPQPSQELLAFRARHFPAKATDHRDRDVTQLVRQRDRRAVDGFARRAWLGYAEDHNLTLDFGDAAKGSGRWFLVLAGWTEYPYPESIYAATRAGVALQSPVLEKLAADGTTWEPVCDLGFPAGLPRVMTRELPGFTPMGKCVLRIRTNMQVFWDQVYLARAEDFAQTTRVTTLDVARADLAARGFMQEVYPDGRPPVAYDDAKTEPVAVTRWVGHLTRLGDVTDLLRATDDRFVLCGPGDELTVRFDAAGLPELPAGWQRSFVLRTWGYCKDTSPTTATGGHVGPLPFRGMPNYPDFGTAKPPASDAARWHTRPAGGR